MTKEQLKTLIEGAVKTNGIQLISGETLQETLKTIVDSLPGYDEIVTSFGGDLLIADDPDPTVPTWYYAGESGTYTNAGGLVVDTTGKIVILNFDGTVWSKIETIVPVADPAKLPLYSAIKSASISATAQFIDDENGNIIYRVKTGQTLLTSELPANVVGTKVEVIGVSKETVDKILQKFPLKSFIKGGNLNPTVDLTLVAGSYVDTTNTYLNGLGITKLGVRGLNGSSNVELNLQFSTVKRTEYLANNGKYIKIKWRIFSKDGVPPTLTADRLAIIGISDTVTYANGKVTYTTVDSQVFEVTAVWKITQATLPSFIYVSTIWQAADVPVGFAIGDLGVSGVGVWYANTLAELDDSLIQYDWIQSDSEVLSKGENDILYAKSADIYGGTLNKYKNIPYIQTAIASFLIKHKWKKVDAFNQLNVTLAGDSILGRQTLTEMTLTPDVNGGVGNGYDTGHFPPNMWNQNIAWYVLQMLQFPDADVKYFNIVSSEITKTGTWNVSSAGADSIRVGTSSELGSTLTMPIPSGHTHAKFIHSNYSVGLGKAAVLKAEFSLDGGTTWVSPEDSGLVASYANNGTNGNYLTPTGNLGTYKWGNIIWKGLNPATSYLIRITLVTGNCAAWGFETWSKPRVNVIVTAEGGNTASEQKTFPQRFHSAMYNQDLIIYELPYLNDLGTGVIANFKGKAVLATVPSALPALNDFWYATVAGTYTNFGGLVAKAGEYMEWSGSAWRIGNTSLRTSIDNYINNNTTVFERLRMQGVPVLALITHDDTLNLTRPFSTDLGLMLMRLMAKKYGFAYLDVNYYQKMKGITAFMSDGTHLNDVGVKMYSDVLKEVFVDNPTFLGLAYPQMNNKVLKGNSATNTVAFGFEFKEIPTVRLFNNHSQIVSSVTKSGFTTTGTDSFDWEAEITV